MSQPRLLHVLDPPGGGAGPSFPARRSEASPATFVSLGSLVPVDGSALPRGIARLAAGAVEIDARNRVEYRDLPCRSLLSACESRRVDFDYTINPYRGCEFGCVYCYARYTHEYMELRDWEAFERKIFVKSGARAALLQDLRRRDFRGQWIAIGTATDPYQPAERRYGITRSVLEVLAGRRDLRISITTKSDLVARDIDLLRRLGEHNEVHVNVTVTTPHHRLARKLEPRAPRPDRRIEALRQLAGAGVRCGVFVMPLMPRINDHPADLDLLVRQAASTGAEYLVAGVLFLRDCSRKRFEPFLREAFPELVPHYAHLYSRRGASELSAYGRDMAAMIQALKREHGLGGWRRAVGPSGREPDQPDLPLLWAAPG